MGGLSAELTARVFPHPPRSASAIAEASLRRSYLRTATEGGLCSPASGRGEVEFDFEESCKKSAVTLHCKNAGPTKVLVNSLAATTVISVTDAPDIVYSLLRGLD